MTFEVVFTKRADKYLDNISSYIELKFGYTAS